MNTYTQFSSKGKKLAVLIDPDKSTTESLKRISQLSAEKDIDFIFVGGSIVSNPIGEQIEIIKSYYSGPIILFPGDPCQITDNADAILYLSLISGRNPEFLIGNQVASSMRLRKSPLEVIPTGYILIDGGIVSSVEYVSNTKPIPFNKPDIAVSTAVAGEMLGQKLIYLEAGSGANKPVSTDIIAAVKKNISIPLIVGGGIKTAEQLRNTYNAGADIVVIGNSLETNPELINEFSKMR